ncbi:MAG: hypothetical protein N2Z75_05230 [Meiothermus sp.]|uniref:hypothetical protein n=1 Tax=Meiothermus sp. TaxID=1955249 RepID=UPI0025E58750|nr:hypothetical protein [Meiothermus sp.]MCS7068003.1 hypothetical protein [Meiothermus sp.]MCX7601327.1 hypothetical protein [Meiothermus sp.]
MQKITLSHRYLVSGSRFREASIETGWLCFQNGAVTVRLHLPLVTRLELSYQMRDWLMALAFVGFFVGLASLGLRWLGWLNLPQLLKVNPALLEYGAFALALIAFASYLLFPIRVLYLHDGNAAPLLVVGSKKAIEDLEYALWAFLEALHRKA